MLILAFAVALHGHVKRKCHRHGQSGDFRLLQLHLRRSGQESRHLFRHSMGLLRSKQLGAQLLDGRLQGFASAALALKVMFDTRERMRDRSASACTAAKFLLPSKSGGLQDRLSCAHYQDTVQDMQTATQFLGLTISKTTPQPAHVIACVKGPPQAPI